MAKLVQSKKETNSNKKAAAAKKTSSKKTTEKVEQETESESESDDGENGHSETKSTLLDDCSNAFGTKDLYKLLGLDKSKATQADIKKAYYKQSLICHPDKVLGESRKQESNFKFQVLGKVYSILSDEEKKKLYDEQGLIDGEDDFFSQHKDWDQYFRDMFKKITKKDIDDFYSKYKDSVEEKADLLKYYDQFKGDLDLISETMISSDWNQDEVRFRKMLNELIEKGEIEKHDAFVNENKKKANKRKTKFEAEAKEAKKSLNDVAEANKTMDDLAASILARRQASNDAFLDNLAKKYSDSSRKTSKKKTGTRKTKKNETSDEENDAGGEESEESGDDDEDEDALKKGGKKTTSRVVKRTSSSLKSSNGKVKVKRL